MKHLITIKKSKRFTFTEVMALAASRCALRLVTQSLFSLGRPCQKVNFSVVWPAAVQPAGTVPNHIERPHYVRQVDTLDWGDSIQLQGHAALQGLRQAGQLARKILSLVAQTLRVGMTTEEIDDFVHRETIEHGAYPSPLGYLGFPKSVCTSVNNVACHGIPDRSSFLYDSASLHVKQPISSVIHVK
uniref:Peptidase M24 domain-containing protein n=1 Tax=Eptatretus burgeri TaxID=7764 RepID=A0A8C4WV52_EPTBU